MYKLQFIKSQYFGKKNQWTSPRRRPARLQTKPAIFPQLPVTVTALYC